MRFSIKFLRKDLSLICLVLAYLSLFNFLPTNYLGVVAASPEATVSVDPSQPIERNTGESFTININIVDVVDLFSWGIKVRWEPRLLEATSITEGPFLKDQPDGTAFVKKFYNNYIDVGCVTLGSWPGVSGSGTLMTVTFNVTGKGATELEIFYSNLLDSAIPSVLINHTVEDGYFYTRQPVASFTYAPKSPDLYGHPLVDETVTFDASASYDPDGSIVSYEWDFGDNVTGTGMIVNHTYEEAGDYIVRLNVTDDEGETDSLTLDPDDVYNLPIAIRFHDVAVVDVSYNVTKVLATEGVEVYVTVMNNGSHPTRFPIQEDSELFNVSLYYFDYTWHFISTYREALKCDPGETVTPGKTWAYQFPFDWNTTGFAPGSYIIWAHAYLVDPLMEFLPGLEANTANNLKSGGPVTVTDKGGHDIAIKAVTVTPAEVKVGESVEINVHVENEGTMEEEDFTVSVYNSTSLIEARNATLVPGAERMLHFSWFEATNTTVQSAYNVSVQVTPVTNETDVADNEFMNVVGTIRLLPVAYFTFSPSEPTSGQTVAFDASGSYAPGIPTKTIDSYNWDFGDGANATGVAVAHAYDTVGTFSVTLTVVDSDDLSSTLEDSLVVFESHETISTISMSLSEVKIVRGGSIIINGSIASTLPGVTVTIWFRAFAETWDTLAVVITDEDGQYSYDWKPRAAETYEVRASWQGDEVAEAGESEVQVIVVREGSTLNIFLYSTVALAVLWVATVVVLLWVRKSKSKW
jgi:PKD repeat protein